MRLGVDGGAVDPQQPTFGGAQEALQSAFGRQLAVQLLAFGLGELVAVGDRLLESVKELLADLLVADGFFGVVADDEPVTHCPVVDSRSP